MSALNEGPRRTSLGMISEKREQIRVWEERVARHGERSGDAETIAGFKRELEELENRHRLLFGENP